MHQTGEHVVKRLSSFTESTKESKYSKNETQIVTRTVSTSDRLYNWEKIISNDEGNMTLELATNIHTYWIGNKYIFGIVIYMHKHTADRSCKVYKQWFKFCIFLDEI